MKERFDKIKDQAKKASSAIGEKVSQASKIAKDSAKTIATTLLDQDGDGVIDQKDVKIMTDKSVVLAKKAANEAKIFVKEASESEIVKDAAGGALVGAAIAVPVPLIGPIAGAAIGAAIGTYAHIRKTSPSSSNSTTKGKVSVATKPTLAKKASSVKKSTPAKKVVSAKPVKSKTAKKAK